MRPKRASGWLESFTLAREAQQALKELTAADSPQAPSPLIVSAGDREADIYELPLEVQTHREEGMGLLVRSQYNRSLDSEDSEEEAFLWEKLSACPLGGTVSLKLPRSQGQKLRTAVLSVRFIPVEIAVPAHKRKYLKMDTPVSRR